VVTVDNTPPPAPTVQILAQGGTGNYTRSSAALSFEGTVEPHVSVQSARLLDQTDALIADMRAVLKLDAAGNISGSYTLGEVPGVTRLKLSVIVQDRAGNPSPVSVSNSLTVDNEKPKVTLLTPVDGAYFNRPPIPFSGMASDELSGVAKVEINIGKGWMAAAGVANWTYSFQPPIEDNFYTVQAKATDKAGNETLSPKVTVNYFSALPAANLRSPTEGAEVRGSVPIIGSAEDTDADLSDFAWTLEFAPDAAATAGWKLITWQAGTPRRMRS
jgi:hypothetical protein